mmetsp:Transcript_55006/g.103052  ORF Transcript_55006/g.103052 Transcript_55006/m.103052 type:complete len:199 (-) Transcript_55006:11-607(-)
MGTMLPKTVVRRLFGSRWTRTVWTRLVAFFIVTAAFESFGSRISNRGWLSRPSILGRRQSVSRLPVRVGVGEPAFRPAYGFDPASPLGPAPQEGEAVAGLRTWLRAMGLEDHLPAANTWCEEMGASVLAEIMESFDDFVEGMELSEEDAETLRKRGRAALSNLQQRGEILEQEAVVDGGDEFKTSGRTFLKKKAAKAG